MPTDVFKISHHRIVLLFCATLLLSAGLVSSSTAQTAWTGLGDGSSWTDSGNWDAGVPGGTTAAEIMGVHTVRLTSATAVGSLFLSGAELQLEGFALDVGSVSSGKLTIAGTSSITGAGAVATDSLQWSSGSVDGPDRLTVTGGGIVDGVSFLRQLGAGTTLEVLGDLTLTRGLFRMAGGSRIAVGSGATLEIADGADISATTLAVSTLEVAGLLRFPEGGTLSTVEAVMEAPFGSIEVYSPVEFRAGGRIGGEVIVGLNGDLEFDYNTSLDADGIYDFEGADFRGDGSVTFSSSTTVAVLDGLYDVRGDTEITGSDITFGPGMTLESLGTSFVVTGGRGHVMTIPSTMPTWMRVGSGAGTIETDVDLTVDSLSITGGNQSEIAGTGDVTIDKLYWSAGNVNGPGRLIVIGDGLIDGVSFLRQIGAGAAMDIRGTLTLSRGLFRMAEGSRIEVGSGATLEITDGADVSATALAVSTIEVGGLLRFSEGGTLSTIEAVLEAPFGSIEVNSPVEFRAGGRIGGDVIVGLDGDLEFDYNTNLDADGIYDFGGANFSGDGSVTFSSSTTSAALDGTYDIGGETRIAGSDIVVEIGSDLRSLGRVISVFSGVIEINARPVLMPDTILMQGSSAFAGRLDANAPLSVDLLDMGGSTIGGEADLTVGRLEWTSGAFDGSGTVRLTNGGIIDGVSFSRSLTGKRMLVEDLFQVGGSMVRLGEGAILEVGPSGVVELANNVTLSVTGTPTVLPIVHNRGVVRKKPGRTTFQPLYDNDGVTEIEAGGEIEFGAGSVVRNLAGGRIEGSGTFDIRQSIGMVNEGVVQPGGAVVDTLTWVGDFDNRNAELSVSILDEVPSFLNVQGSASLGGGLSMVHSGVEPANGSVLPILGADLVEGTFDEVQGPFLSGMEADLSYTPTEARVTIVDMADMAPEALDDLAFTTSGVPVTIDVVWNDRDRNREPLFLLGADQGGRGSTQVVDNEVLYSPQGGFVGDDTFEYTIADGSGLESRATVTVRVADPATRLFTAFGAEEQSSSPEIIRTRRATMDTLLLSTLAVSENARATLQLFDDVTIVFDQVSGSRWTGSRVSWIGTTGDGSELAIVEIDRSGPTAYGSVLSKGRAYEFVHLGEADYEIREIVGGLDDEGSEDFDEEDIDPIEEGPIDIAEVFPQQVNLNGSAGKARTDVIDMLVLYTDVASDTSTARGRSIINRIYAAVDLTNQAFANSGVDIRARLAAVARVGLAETGKAGPQVRRLKKEGNKVGTGLYNLRARYGADVVGLVVSSLSDAGGRAAGILQNQDNTNFRNRAYFVLTEGSLGQGSLTFPHELGHVMGLYHDWRVEKRPGFNHGYVNPPDNWTSPADTSGGPNQWRTIMAYPNRCKAQAGSPSCPRQLQFSDPNASINGNPAGVDILFLRPAYNVERLRRTSATVAAFMSPANIVSGLITDVQNSQSLEGARVNFVLNDPDATTSFDSTDANGRYEIVVPSGLSVTITPTLPGYEIEPPSVTLANVSGDVTRDFDAFRLFDVTGKVAASGNGLQDIDILVEDRDNVVTGSDGTYALQLPFGYDQILRPFSLAHDFTPPNIDFSVGPIAGDVVQDFVATLKRHKISGTLAEFPGGRPIPNTVIAGLPGEPVTDAQGRYEIELDHFWSGTFTPQNIKYNFEPVSRTVPKLGSPIVQDFEGRAATVAESDWPVVGQGLRHQARLDAPNSSKFERWSSATNDGFFDAPVVGPDGLIFLTNSYDGTRPGQSFAYLSIVAGDGSSARDVSAAVLGIPSRSGLSPAVVGTAGVVYFSYWSESAGQSGIVAYDYVQHTAIPVPPPVGNEIVGQPPVIGTDGLLYTNIYGNPLELIANSIGRLDRVSETSTPFRSAVPPSFDLLGNRFSVAPFSNSELVAHDASGVEQWRFVAGDRITGTPVVVPSAVYVGSQDGFVYAVDPSASGSQLWRTAVHAPSTSPAVGFDGTLYVGTSADTLYAIASDGRIKWNIGLDGSIEIQPAVSYTKVQRLSELADEEYVYVTTSSRTLYAIDATKSPGRIAWQLDLPVGPAKIALTSQGLIYTSFADLVALTPYSRALVQVGIFLADELADPDKLAFILWVDSQGGPLAVAEAFKDDLCAGGPVILPECPTSGSRFDPTSPLLEVIAERDLVAGIAERTAQLDAVILGDSQEGLLKTSPVRLEEGEVRVIAVGGLRNPETFAPNPDGRETNLDVFISNDLSASFTGDNNVFVVAGNLSTDAAGLGFALSGAGEAVFNDVMFGDLSDVVAVPAGQFQLDLTVPGLGKQQARNQTFSLDLTDRSGELITLFATGFVDPDANGGGQPIGVVAGGSAGPVEVGGSVAKQDIELPADLAIHGIFPNPFSGRATLQYALPAVSTVIVDVYNILGRRVVRQKETGVAPGIHKVVLDGTGLASGIYFVRLSGAGRSEFSKMTIVN